MLHIIGPPTLNVPRGAECLGTNVFFLKHISGFQFVISVFFLVFPPIFTWHFVALKNSSWRRLHVVETLGGRFRFTLLHNRSPRHATQAVYYESDVNYSKLCHPNIKKKTVSQSLHGCEFTIVYYILDKLRFCES